MASPKNRMRPVHPGVILREDVLAPMGLSANALARDLRVPVTQISEIPHGRRAITANTVGDCRVAALLAMTD